MTILYAQPYDTSATGFYFESKDSFQAKAQSNRNDFGHPVEEYEIQFIDGEAIDCALADAWHINQINIGGYFDAVDGWEENDKLIFIIAVGEVGYSFAPDNASASDFDIDIYHVESLKELAVQLVDDGLFGDIPSHLSNYIDMDAIALDLAFDYTETEVAGQFCIYRAG